MSYLYRKTSTKPAITYRLNDKLLIPIIIFLEKYLANKSLKNYK